MAKRIVIIQGHPDPGGGHFGQALANAYAQGAEQAGHSVKHIAVATLDFPLLRTKADWDSGAPLPVIRDAQEVILWAEHLVILYPLWLGGMPALLKGFFEQVLRPGLVAGSAPRGGGHADIYAKPLKGRTAHIVVTMGMPAWAYRWYFGAHSLRSLERNILRFVGIKPKRESLIGMIEAKPSQRQAWLTRMHDFGRAAT